MHITIPVTLFAEIAADKVAVANARIRDLRADKADHGKCGGWHMTRRVWSRQNDNCGTWSYKSLAATRTNADADIAAYTPESTTPEPLAYSSDVGYIG